jgi:cytochrome c-type biogenesis protein CcmF
MTTYIGNYSLCAAVLVAVVILLVSLAAMRSGSQNLYRICRRGMGILFALLTLASVMLMTAMAQSDFSLNYVVRYTERALPTGYKLAAFWAGQEGSLLLWGWLLAVIGVVFAFQFRNDENAQHAAAFGTLAAVIAFFAALMLFAASPFTPVDAPVADGRGLNPMLQDPGMIIHPPILFVGYAGFTIPFALLVASLIARRSDDEWLARARPWVVWSWLFLGAGILLGAQWAYVELGWGGYWAWDPVENASLLPWLTGTALLHSSIGQRSRGVFKRWNAFLAAATFILCIFGTYITRSGVVDSVHTFGKSLVGTFFFVFLVLTTLFSTVLVLVRWGTLKPERPIESYVSREGIFLAGNILLVAMTVLTTLGTMFPAITRAAAGQSLTVSQSFYNRAVLPLALLMVAVMALAPVLGYGRNVAKKLLNNLAIPLAVAVVSIVILAVLGIRSVWALSSAAVCAVLLVSILIDTARGVRARQRNTHENLFVATLKLLDANHRRYGSHVVHAGVALMVIGIAGSSLYNTKETLQLRPGDASKVGRYNLKLEKLHETRDVNFSAVEAVVTLVDPSGNRHDLRPQRRFYDKAEDANSEVALRSGWREDLYVTLAGWEDGGKLVALQVLINPLMKWIWVGGIAVAVGAIVALLPRVFAAPQFIPVDANEVEVTTVVKNRRRRRELAGA